ncbi:hypothetical protein BLNAU_15541 [Blattamonas nauphoetae]|uniref:Hyaluronan/mRNA-binding protein domain-containing protein n=1 Tax=Blattamonas nauphoetae TaxID=2049346 RepID=A0ABQ9XDT2_9EUKA|nr:hypothetical protein BLNAU_15541 [Blattamonas nauphoetae]
MDSKSRNKEPELKNKRYGYSSTGAKGGAGGSGSWGDPRDPNVDFDDYDPNDPNYADQSPTPEQEQKKKE